MEDPVKAERFQEYLEIREPSPKRQRTQPSNEAQVPVIDLSNDPLIVGDAQTPKQREFYKLKRARASTPSQGPPEMSAPLSKPLQTPLPQSDQPPEGLSVAKQREFYKLRSAWQCVHESPSRPSEARKGRKDPSPQESTVCAESERIPPCLGCARSALAGKSDGRCYDSETAGARYERCTAGGRCDPMYESRFPKTSFVLLIRAASPRDALPVVLFFLDYIESSGFDAITNSSARNVDTTIEAITDPITTTPNSTAS
ncbi:uncharacterized protein E0L32_008287 [Thyridium curvatum]|uniref:Uncharacterized protein n=1 Tax=Thyridium curvatum TaxID=1093900 RepID=A0A507B178_9PEZI|nr:uncharacterized protein E0L32_008287 [Thyridium curvatum]TPX10718.1 hypothetical protein E0L32_008287 [Thyridium curvatum]